MNKSENKNRLKTIIIFAIIYFFIGIITADISNPLTSSGTQVAWRLTAFAVSAVVFAVHIRLESIRLLHSPQMSAINTSSAVALGTFVIAVAANINAMLNGSSSKNWLALALLIWPIVTGVLSFLAAYIAAGLITWIRSQH